MESVFGLAACLAMGACVVIAAIVCLVVDHTFAVQPNGEGRSNCLLYAFSRCYHEGGHVIVTWSEYGYWLHFQWTEDFVTAWEFHPVKPKRRRWIVPLMFTGYPMAVALVAEKNPT